jgi:hypothetical protein
VKIGPHREDYQVAQSRGNIIIRRSPRTPREPTALTFSDLIKSRTKAIFLVLIIAGMAVTVSALVMAFTFDQGNAIDLYTVESAFMSVGMVMLCLGIILMKNGEEILGTSISDLEKQRMHDEMHEQVMSEMRLSQKDLEIQKTVQENGDDLFK